MIKKLITDPYPARREPLISKSINDLPISEIQESDTYFCIGLDEKITKNLYIASHPNVWNLETNLLFRNLYIFYIC